MGTADCDTRSTRIPTLDGWRGIAILLVCINHLQGGLHSFIHIGGYLLDVGIHGVEIFFVLSGYLITSRLLSEEKIHLPTFYLRRFFRLMPCAWAYLIAIVLFATLTHLRLVGDDLPACIFFFRNYFPAVETSSNALTSHFWSLSMEEQFYLVWPLLLASLGKRGAFAVSILAIVGIAIYRFTFWNLYTYQLSPLRTEVRADALLIGCCLAILVENDLFRTSLREHSTAIMAICFPVLLGFMYRFHGLVPVTESIVIAFLLGATSLNPTSVVGRIFEWHHLRFLGVISYSVYVWQELFLVPHWGLIGPAVLPAVALSSWLFIERPFRKLGSRMSYKLSPNEARHTLETAL